MSESLREHHPLLCDELSDEELRPHSCNPQFKQRFRPTFYSVRPKNHDAIKGAAAIVARWPGYWTSSLTHLFVGFGMIALTVLIIYNSIIAFSLLPPAYTKSVKPLPTSKLEIPLHESSKSLQVFMHEITNYIQEIDFNKYQHIEELSSKYSDFKFNFIILINDTHTINNVLSAEENNANALNALWNLDRKHEKQSKNINIKYISLSKYLNDSPLRKYWKILPHHYMEFLVRAISIWDKGGIAFNPEILTSQFSQANYLDKLHSVFKKYELIKSKQKLENIKKKLDKTNNKKMKKKVNNIRDIIDALEQEDDFYNSNQHNLSEAENKVSSYSPQSRRKLLSTTVQMVESPTELIKTSNSDSDHLGDARIPLKNVETEKTLLSAIVEASKQNNDSLTKFSQKNDTTLNLLPLFIEFFHHDKKNNTLNSQETESFYLNNTTSMESKSEINKKVIKNVSASTLGILEDNMKDFQPKSKIIENKETRNDIGTDESHYNYAEELTIDLKGNILATKTSCHAFIGSLFSDVVHHTEYKTLTDLIITELSSFCNGVLSSCKGIDVILL